MSCWGHPHRPCPGSGTAGDCTALGRHGFEELSTCVAPERSLDTGSEVARERMVENSGLQQLQSLPRPLPCPTPPCHTALGSSPGVPAPRTRTPPPCWLAVRGCWALCLVFFLTLHFVTLSGVLLSLPARGHQCCLLDRKPEAEAKESQRKPNTELAGFQPHGSSSMSPSKKIGGIIMVCRCHTEAFLPF